MNRLDNKLIRFVAWFQRPANIIVLAVCVLLLLAALMGKAHAQQVWLAPGAASYHTDRDSQYCERNPGALAEARWGDHALIGGRYKNSICGQTNVIAYRYTALRIGPCFASGICGTVDGYAANGGRFIPVAAPEIGCGSDRIEFGLMAIPPVDKHIDGWSFVASVRVRVW